MENQFDPQAMDSAATEAAKQLKLTLEAQPTFTVGVDYLAQWWKENYLKAGHKRLARILLARGKTANGNGKSNGTTKKNSK